MSENGTPIRPLRALAASTEDDSRASLGTSTTTSLSSSPHTTPDPVHGSPRGSAPGPVESSPHTSTSPTLSPTHLKGSHEQHHRPHREARCASPETTTSILVAWNEALEALRPDNDVVSVTVEQPDAGNVDDVVLRRRARPHRYIQVKHAVDATTPVGHQWMTDRAKPTASSLMEKFHRSWLHLTADTGPAELVLVTDREIDPHDPVMRLLDRRTQLLVPSIGHTNASQGRRLWADHLNIAEDELMAFLASLRFMTGRPLASERERAATLMWTMGLNYDQRALDSALGLVRDWVQLPERTLEPGEFRAWANDRVGLRTEPGAVVVIEAIDNDPHPDDAAEVVNFVADYMGDTPNERRQLHDENQWPRIGADIEQAAQRLRQSGVHRVIIRGAMRLPVWFAAGAAFRHVHGFHAAAMQIDALWSSEDLGTPIEIRCETVQAGSGPDIAVCVGIAADPNHRRAQLCRIDGTLPIGHVTSIPARQGHRPRRHTRRANRPRQQPSRSATPFGMSSSQHRPLTFISSWRLPEPSHCFSATAGTHCVQRPSTSTWVPATDTPAPSSSPPDPDNRAPQALNLTTANAPVCVPKRHRQTKRTLLMDQLLTIAAMVAAVQLLFAPLREWSAARRIVAVGGLDAEAYAVHGCVPLQFAGSPLLDRTRRSGSDRLLHGASQDTQASVRDAQDRRDSRRSPDQLLRPSTS